MAFRQRHSDGFAMIGIIIEGVLGFALESARCKQLKDAYVGPAVDIARFQGWASPHRLNSQLGLSQRDARFVLIVACQRGLIFQAVNGRFYLAPAQPEAARPNFDEASPKFEGITEIPVIPAQTGRSRGVTIICGSIAAAIIGAGAWAAASVGKAPPPRAVLAAPLSAPSSTSSSLPLVYTQDRLLSAKLNDMPAAALAKPVHRQPHSSAKRPNRLRLPSS